MYLNVAQTSPRYTGNATMGVNLKTTAVVPAIAASGVVNGASYQHAIAPASWAAIFGPKPAAASRTLTSSDLINGNMPTIAGSVSISTASRHTGTPSVPRKSMYKRRRRGRTGSSNSYQWTSLSVPAALQDVCAGFLPIGGYTTAERPDGTGFGPTLRRQALCWKCCGESSIPSCH